MTRTFAIILSLAMFASAEAKPPKRPVAAGARGAHPARIGGPAKRTGTIGGPAPRAGLNGP
jgi:hypothetical protein